MIRDRLGRFELRSEIGRGGFADVYLAFDPERGEEVALKVYRISSADPEALAAEQSGVALQRDLAEHAPQVAAIHSWGTDDGYYWVAMEHVPGIDLSKVLEKGALPEERAVAIAREIAAMLEVCHRFEVAGNGTHGVVHGDIKPENLRLQGEGENERVRVLDFGIAKPLSGTSTRNLFGSSMFRPPEYLEDGHVDRHTDLWALGVVLYLMVSGQRPFTGRNDEELDTRIRTGAPPRGLPEERSSPRLRRIVYRCLRFDVRERYGSARELGEDLADLAAGRPLKSERPEDPLDSTEVLRLSGRPAQPERENGDPNATRRTRAVAGGPTVATGGMAGNGGSGPFGGLASAPTGPSGPPGSGSGPMPYPGAPAYENGGSGPMASLGSMTPPAKRSRGCLWLAVLGIAAFAGFIASEILVWKQAGAMRHDLVTEARPDVDAIWQRYQTARRRCLLCFGLLSVRGELHDELVRSADRTLATYRTDDPTTREGDWHRAYAYAQAAVDLSWSDDATRARMVYCHGQLDRIEAQRLTGEERRRKYGEAIAAFQEAASANRSWPDPYLGLAWIYAYGQRDVDKLKDALAKLEERGYAPGRREKAMLADACLKQGFALTDQAAKADGTDEERQFLGRARELFEQAIETYGEIPGFAAVQSNRAKAERAIEAIDTRVAAIEGEGQPAPTPPPADSDLLGTDAEPDG